MHGGESESERWWRAHDGGGGRAENCHRIFWGNFFRFLLRSIMLILNDNIIQSSRIKSNVIRRDCSTCLCNVQANSCWCPRTAYIRMSGCGVHTIEGHLESIINASMHIIRARISSACMITLMKWWSGLKPEHILHINSPTCAGPTAHRHLYKSTKTH